VREVFVGRYRLIYHVVHGNKEMHMGQSR
jgi:hypothetical protein